MTRFDPFTPEIVIPKGVSGVSKRTIGDKAEGIASYVVVEKSKGEVTLRLTNIKFKESKREI